MKFIMSLDGIGIVLADVNQFISQYKENRYEQGIVEATEIVEEIIFQQISSKRNVAEEDVHKLSIRSNAKKSFLILLSILHPNRLMNL